MYALQLQVSRKFGLSNLDINACFLLPGLPLIKLDNFVTRFPMVINLDNFVIDLHLMVEFSRILFANLVVHAHFHTL